MDVLRQVDTDLRQVDTVDDLRQVDTIPVTDVRQVDTGSHRPSVR